MHFISRVKLSYIILISDKRFFLKLQLFKTLQTIQFGEIFAKLFQKTTQILACIMEAHSFFFNKNILFLFK